MLARFPTAETTAKASVEEIRQVRYGKHRWHLPGAVVSNMKALSQDSIAYKKGPGSGFVVESLVKSIKQYQKDIEIIKEQMQQLYQKIKPKDSLLTTISGISKEVAVVLEAYFGDVHRFPNSKKFVAYFGLNPTVNQSGKKTWDAYMEKKGSGVVRHKLYMAILGIIRHQEGPIYAYYQRLVIAGKAKLVAIGAAMRKLLVIMYTMLKNQTPFDPNKHA